MTALPELHERPLYLVAPSSLDQFLTDGEIGPVTGLSVLLAKTRLVNQVGEVPAEVRSKVFLGYASTCIVHGEYDRAEDLYDAYPELFKENAEYIKRLRFERSGYGIDGRRTEERHKFKTLASDPKGVRNQRKDLIAKLENEEHIVDERFLERYTPEEREQMQRACRTIEYDLRRNLFGIELAYGRMNKAMKQANLLDTMQEFSYHGHTRATIDYLRKPTSNGHTGEEVLKKSMGLLPNPLNPTGWKMVVGTPSCPGKLLHPVMATMEETTWNIAGGAAATGLAYLGQYLLRHYSPETLVHLQNMMSFK